jgi:HPt (histidine-containing phosphotransfer) domain-containing protein
MPNQELDLQTFEELRQMSGAEFAGELVDTFLEDAPERIADLRSALMRQDSEAFRRAAHSLKSNGDIFGARRLAALARELEVMGKEKKLAGQAPKVDELEGIYRKVASELKDLRQ